MRPFTGSPYHLRVPSRLDSILRQNSLLSAGERVLVACSGGGDSVALLHLLLGSTLGLELVVAHLDHGLRPGAAADAEFVQRLCRELDVTAVVERIPVDPAAGAGPADAARRVRLAFLERTAREVGATAIATAHQQDDQAETILLRLATGSGPAGPAGIPSERVVSTEPSLRYVRPLLAFRRHELREWLAERGLEYRDDPSNEGRTPRALLRNEVLPRLCRAVGRDVVPRLAAHADQTERTAALLEDVTAPFVDGIEVTEDEVRVHPGLELLPPPLLHSLLAPRLGELGVTRIGAAELHDLVHGVRDVAGLRSTPLPDGGHRLGRVASASPSFSPTEVALPGRTTLSDGRRLLLEAVARDGISLPRLLRLAASSTGDVLAADGVEGPVHARPPAPGDRIQPLGADAEARLGHVLQRRGLPAAERGSTVVLVDRRGPLLVPGVVVAHRARVTDETDDLLLVEIR